MLVCIVGGMLRRAENVHIQFTPGWLTKRGWLAIVIANCEYRINKYNLDQYRTLAELQLSEPVNLADIDSRVYWWFCDLIYWDNDGLSRDDVHALLITRHRQQRQKIDRAKAIVALDAEVEPARRRAIPDDVKLLVWTRDKGKCNHCGSQNELQFDHVIPLSLGGGSTDANLQILCGPCNRRKGGGLNS